MLESLVKVLLFYTMPCVIDQVDTASTHPRQVLTDLVPIVAAVLHTHLERKRPY